MKKVTFASVLFVSSLITLGCVQEQAVKEPLVNAGEGIVISVSVDGISKGEFSAADVASNEIIYGDNNSKKVKISTIIDAVAGITGANLSNYYCDYESEDGFRPSLKGDDCSPRLCETTSNAYVDIETGLMSYDEDWLNGCYRVKGLNLILMTSGQPTTMPLEDENKVAGNNEDRIITVVFDDTTKDVSLSKLANGADSILISSIILSATGKSEAELSSYLCDYRDGGGIKMSDKKNCSELWSCSDTLNASLSLSEGAISYSSDFEKDASGCRLWSNVKEIILNKSE